MKLTSSIRTGILAAGLLTGLPGDGIGGRDSWAAEVDTGAGRQDHALAAWIEYSGDHPGWSCVFDATTGASGIAAGPSFPITDHSSPGAGEIAIAGERFLLSHPDLFPAREFRLEEQRRVLDNWHLRFTQTIDGLPLRDASIQLRISSTGRLMLFRGHFLRDTPVHVPISVDLARARMLAADAAGGTIEDWLPSDPPLQAEHVLRGDEAHWRAVWRFERMDAGAGAWELCRIDAGSGELLSRESLGEHLTGTVRGDVQQLTPWGPYYDRPFAHEWVEIGDDIVEVDADGEFSLEFEGERELWTELRGAYIRVVDESGPEPVQELSVTGEQHADLYWSDDNSQRAERNTFHHAWRAYDYLQLLESGFSGLDHLVTFHVRDTTDHCNGFWAGNHVYLYAAGDGCADYGEIADVIIHEYGHALSYAQYGAYYPNGTATAEALSDVFAAYVTEQPLMAAGAYGPGTWGRNLNNDLVYPDDLNGEIHHDGLILGGVFWDLRQELGEDRADTLFHYCKYGCPVEFDDFLFEVLLVDDDDGNLSNGTPNGATIFDCFGRHGIGSGMLPALEHTPLGDTQNTSQPYMVFVRVLPSAFGVDPDSLRLYHRSEDDWIQEGFELFTPPNVYRAEIPPCEEGSLVRYYITAVDSIGQSVTLPVEGSEHPFFFLVGSPLLAFDDDLEEDLGWITDLPGDDAETGRWERVVPVGTWVGERPIQPAADHTADGEYCWLTGNAQAGDPAGENDVDGGCTTLLSPELQVEGLSHPVISYYRWWVDDTVQDDALTVEASADGGASWVLLESVGATENSWIQRRFLLEEYLPGAETVVLRLRACDTGSGSLVEAALDDVRLLAPDSTEAAVRRPVEAPASLRLSSLYPNPFNRGTWVEFELPLPSPVTLTVFDLRGGRIATRELGIRRAGSHRVQVPSEGLSSGLYLLALEIPGESVTRKMLRIK